MCLRFWKLRAGGANKKRKIYYCRTMNSNVEVIGDMEPETALAFSAKAEGGYQPYVWEYAIYKGDTLYYTLSGSTFDYLEWSPTETGNYTIVVCVIDSCHVIAYLLEFQRPYFSVGFHFAFGKAFDGNDAVAVFYGNDTVAEQTAHDDKADADAETREGFVECFHHACF